MLAYNVVGVMSGTSMDGVDLVFCKFHRKNMKWAYSIIKASTIPFTKQLLKKIYDIDKLTGYEFMMLHNEFGSYIGNCINNFLKDTRERVDLIASHGHTVFHRPDEKLTFQLGSGAEIAAKCRTTTISDFRSLDIALSGQGAPLVPVGDELLFKEYKFCLNLGGFANISYAGGNDRIAYDICPVNIIINHLAGELNRKLDRDGKIARNGKINNDLLEELNSISYYRKSIPKSLSREWLVREFLPLVNKYKLSVENKLRTVYEHIAIQITKNVNKKVKGTILVTGGGAFNKFLLELLRERFKSEVVIPDKTLVKYKEALIFAFLGVLRLRKEVNCLSSVTGAESDTCTGTVYYY
jgi:anhydro-N-acetylmuramic acid kinase